MRRWAFYLIRLRGVQVEADGPRLPRYLLVLRAPPLLLSPHLLLVVPPLLPLLLLAQLLLSPLLLQGAQGQAQVSGHMALAGASPRLAAQNHPKGLRGAAGRATAH